VPPGQGAGGDELRARAALGPRGPGGASEARGRASPRHVEGAVTDEVTAHGVKRFRPAGPGAARGPTRRGVPARRAGLIMPSHSRDEGTKQYGK